MRTDRTFWQQAVVWAMVVVVFLTVGCYGPNKLGTSLAKWNYGISDDKWTIEAVFFGLWAFGVYEICGLLDLFVLNAIEFWSTDKPSTKSAALETPDVKTIEQGDLRIVLERQRIPEGWQIRACVYQRGELVEQAAYIARGDGVAEKIDGDGNVVASARLEADGTVTALP